MRNVFVAVALLASLSIAPTGSFAQTTPGPSSTATMRVTPSPAASTTDTPTRSSTATPTPSVTDTPAPAVAPTPFVSGVPCATDDPTNERVHRSERHGDDEGDIGNSDHDEFRTGNGTNAAIVHNCTDNRLRVRAAIQLDTIPGHTVDPLNEAYAESTCNGCRTLAVALQIALYSSKQADDIQPQNYAVAVNTSCTGCITIADAIQYVQGEDNPREVSQDISDDIKALADELSAIQSDPSVTIDQAEKRINNVIARFQALGGTLNQQRDEHDD